MCHSLKRSLKPWQTLTLPLAVCPQGIPLPSSEWVFAFQMFSQMDTRVMDGWILKEHIRFRKHHKYLSSKSRCFMSWVFKYCSLNNVTDKWRGNVRILRHGDPPAQRHDKKKRDKDSRKLEVGRPDGCHIFPRRCEFKPRSRSVMSLSTPFLSLFPVALGSPGLCRNVTEVKWKLMEDSDWHFEHQTSAQRRFPGGS